MKMPRQRADVLALQALAFLAEDRDLLDRFLAISGMDADGLRASAGDAGTLIAVLDFLMFDDRLVVAFAERTEIRPEEVARVRFALAGPEILPD